MIINNDILFHFLLHHTN